MYTVIDELIKCKIPDFPAIKIFFVINHLKIDIVKKKISSIPKMSRYTVHLIVDNAVRYPQ